MQFDKISILAIIYSLQFANVTQASDDTNGPNGIRSSGLQLANGSLLTGNGIGIGQVETFRPGDPTSPNGLPFDTLGTPVGGLINSSIDPAEVFFARYSDPVNPIGTPPFNPTKNNTTGGETNEHPVQVAGVIISTDTQPIGTPQARGVATGTKLFSTGSNAILNQKADSLTSQHIATQNGGDIRAINLSFGNILTGAHVTDGNSLYTQFIDWSARKHNTLYVVGGTQLDEVGNPSDIPIPTDNFNGLTVAKSEKDNNGVYRKVSDGNDFSHDAVGARTSIDIIAPGVGVLLASQGNVNKTEDGTSFAAPHVTGTVALLQEYGDDRIAANAPNWGGTFNSKPTARRHEVMKAVFMNSADKLEDSGDGFRLGMTRTVEKKNGDTWLDSPAFSPPATSDAIPLDEEMGAGHLNASRALKQFQGGETDATNPFGTIVPQVGWDYGNTNETGATWNEYVFTDPLPKDSFVSITLAWDREVDFTPGTGDANGNGQYDIGDTFTDNTFNDLDIRLHNVGADIADIPVAGSFSSNNLEHLFFKIPATGQYEFWVEEFDDVLGNGTGTDYAVAWWAFDGPVVVAGDYDGNGIAEQSDYIAWRDSFGQSVTPGSGADGNNNGLIDAADYTVWRDAFAAAAVSAPEPSALLLFLVAITTIGGLSARAERLALS